MADETTRAWCVERGHPFVTYNPWLGNTWCRCGERRVQGEQPQDERAKREVFHSCTPGEPCRCYLPARAR
jgi:hypothetical protein